MKSRLRRTKPIIALGMMVVLSGSVRGETPTVTAPSSSQPAPQAKGKTRRVLESFPTSRGVFELSMSPKTKKGYGFDITWREEGKEPSTATMPWFAATRQYEERENVDLRWGADPNHQAWSFGIEDDYVATVARPVVLDDDTTGLLVTQCGGFDVLRRHHRLLAPINGRLKTVWEFDQGDQLSWSATIVLPQAKDTPGQIALFLCRLSGIPDQVEHVAVTKFVWNREKTRLVSMKPGQGSSRVVTALLIGNFTTPAEAVSQQETLSKCLKSQWVLSHDSIKEIPSSHTALVQWYVRREEAELEKKRLTKCGIKLPIKIVDLF